MADEFRVGILGLGRSGWAIHADAIKDHPRFTVSAVADPVPERRSEAVAAFGCAAYDDPYDVIADDVDVIVVATPSASHVPQTLAALAAGKHVVVEKPMAQSAEEIDRMVKAAEQADQLLTCYQPRRFDADFAAVRDIVRSGQLGEIILTRRSLHHFLRRTDWQMLRKFDGGALSNAIPHLLDQTLLLLDDPSQQIDVFVDLRHTIGAGDAEDHAIVCLRPESGPLIELEASYCVALPQPEWWVVGTAGSLQGSLTDGLTRRWSDPNLWSDVDVDEGPAAGRRYGSQEVLPWNDEHLSIAPAQRTPALTFYDGLAESIHTGAELLVTPQSVRRQIEIIAHARSLVEAQANGVSGR